MSKFMLSLRERTCALMRAIMRATFPAPCIMKWVACIGGRVPTASLLFAGSADESRAPHQRTHASTFSQRRYEHRGASTITSMSKMVSTPPDAGASSGGSLGLFVLSYGFILPLNSEIEL